MWVRKSEEEIQKIIAQSEEKRKSLRRPILFASLMTLIALLLYSIGWRGGFKGILLFASSNSSPTIGVGAFLFVFFFTFAYWNQRRYGGLTSVRDALLCRECKKPAHANPNHQCQCGGLLEPFDYFDWVTEDEEHRQVNVII